MRFLRVVGLALLGALPGGCVSPGVFKPAPWPRHTLAVEQTWQLNSPHGERFDASGLFLTADGDLLTVNDRGPGVFSIRFSSKTNTADLIQLENCFTPSQLAPFAGEKFGRYDIEGIAGDGQGRIYLCEEGNRWIMRFDPLSDRVERLPIDWSPVQKYFNPADRNASFEGVAIWDGRLYAANEREQGRIIVVDLNSMKVVDDFEVRPAVASIWPPHYSDLCWFQGALYVLMREDHEVLKVDPITHRVLEEYDFRSAEFALENEYKRLYPLTGVMEGLAVDAKNIWLVTDNNGLARKRHPIDARPTLFRCPRPDKASTAVFCSGAPGCSR